MMIDRRFDVKHSDDVGLNLLDRSNRQLKETKRSRRDSPELGWLPTLDTFRTLVAYSLPAISALG
jgi:hypothetical protein